MSTKHESGGENTALKREVSKVCIILLMIGLFTLSFTQIASGENWYGYIGSDPLFFTQDVLEYFRMLPSEVQTYMIGEFQKTLTDPKERELAGSEMFFKFMTGEIEIEDLYQQIETLSGEEYLVDRLWGQTSEGTAVAVSQAGWSSSKVVLLARNDHFADALAGVPLAYAFRNAPGVNAPVPLLLTQPRGLSSETKAEIQRLGADTVIILGGPGAVLSQVESQLWQTLGVREVQRIWGETAPGTARDIFQRIRSYGYPTPDTAIIATQVNFQDALAVSSPAAANNMPILLSNLNSLPSETLEALSQGGIKNTIIVGGGAVVSGDVEADLNNRGYNVLARLWGATEYDTAIEIANRGNFFFHFTKPGAIFIARGDFFTDALSGGALASRMNPAPILLTHPGGLSQALSSYLASNRANITKVYILGGPGALSDNLQAQIGGLAQ